MAQNTYNFDSFRPQSRRNRAFTQSDRNGRPVFHNRNVPQPRYDVYNSHGRNDYYRYIYYPPSRPQRQQNHWNQPRHYNQNQPRNYERNNTRRDPPRQNQNRPNQARQNQPRNQGPRRQQQNQNRFHGLPVYTEQRNNNNARQNTTRRPQNINQNPDPRRRGRDFSNNNNVGNLNNQRGNTNTHAENSNRPLNNSRKNNRRFYNLKETNNHHPFKTIIVGKVNFITSNPVENTSINPRPRNTRIERDSLNDTQFLEFKRLRKSFIDVLSACHNCNKLTQNGIPFVLPKIRNDSFISTLDKDASNLATTIFNNYIDERDNLTNKLINDLNSSTLPGNSKKLLLIQGIKYYRSRHSKTAKPFKTNEILFTFLKNILNWTNTTNVVFIYKGYTHVENNVPQFDNENIQVNSPENLFSSPLETSLIDFDEVPPSPIPEPRKRSLPPIEEHDSLLERLLGNFTTPRSESNF